LRLKSAFRFTNTITWLFLSKILVIFIKAISLFLFPSHLFCLISSVLSPSEYDYMNRKVFRITYNQGAINMTEYTIFILAFAASFFPCRVIRPCQPTWLCRLFRVLPSGPPHISSQTCTTCQLSISANTVCSGHSPFSSMCCQAHKCRWKCIFICTFTPN
jgi:hypothetical protein